MKQSNQSVQTDRTKVVPSQPSYQSFESAFQYAIQWTGTIPTKRVRRKVNVSMFMGNNMAQSWPDLLIWEAFFNQYNFKTFIELGTGHGGLALFFALQCIQRDIDFHTFDNVKSIKNNHISELVNLEDKFHHVDLFKEGHSIISGLIRRKSPVAVFFDDGDKPREWQTFAPLTKPGDFCIVHDWGTEFGVGDTAGIPVVRLFGKLSDSRPPGLKSMWFQRE